jgi:WD40 repeat protein
VVTVSGDNKLIATVGHDLSIILWNAVDGTRVRTLPGKEQSVESIAFSPDVSILASSGGQDKTARLWDQMTGELLHTLDGHGGTVHAVAFAPDGKSLATACRDRVVRLWDTRSGKLLARLRGRPLRRLFTRRPEPGRRWPRRHRLHLEYSFCASRTVPCSTRSISTIGIDAVPAKRVSMATILRYIASRQDLSAQVSSINSKNSVKSRR